MSRRGFTLLETLVALAIGALVLAALYGAVARAASTRDRAATRAEQMAVARTLLLRMGSEIEAALGADEPLSAERFVVVGPREGAPPWWTLRFVSAAGDELRLLGYEVEAAAAGPGTLVRRSAGRFAAGDSAMRTPVAGAVHRFEVRCFDGAEWRTAWTRPGVPRAVALALDVDDGLGGVEQLATTVVLATAGS